MNLRSFSVVTTAFLLLWGSPAMSQDAEWHIFSRKSDGQRLPKPAQIISVNATHAQIQLEGARGAMRVDRSIFSDADQEIFDAWMAKHAESFQPRMDFTVATGKRSSTTTGYGLERFQLSVEVENRESDFAIEGARLTVFGFGRRQSDSGADVKVLVRQDFDLDLQPLESTELTCQEVENRVSEDSYGHKFYSHLIVVQSAAGHVVAIQGVPTTLETLGEAALKLGPGDYCNRHLQETTSTGLLVQPEQVPRE